MYIYIYTYACMYTYIYTYTYIYVNMCIFRILCRLRLWSFWGQVLFVCTSFLHPQKSSVHGFAVCYSVLQCVAVCCSLLLCVAAFCLCARAFYTHKRALLCTWLCSVLQCVAVCCSVLQCVSVCFRALQGAAVCFFVLQCAAMCCGVLQYAAVCCSVLQCAAWTTKGREFTVLQSHPEERYSHLQSICWNLLQQCCCNLLQCCYNVLQSNESYAHNLTHCNTLQHTAHCDTLQNTCALQHTATHCNTLQHTETHLRLLSTSANVDMRIFQMRLFVLKMALLIYQTNIQGGAES